MLPIMNSFSIPVFSVFIGFANGNTDSYYLFRASFLLKLGLVQPFLVLACDDR